MRLLYIFLLSILAALGSTLSQAMTHGPKSIHWRAYLVHEDQIFGNYSKFGKWVIIFIANYIFAFIVIYILCIYVFNKLLS